MSFDTASAGMTLDQLATRCAEETGHFFGGRAAPCPCCFELFRRALARGDQGAWAALYAQYSGLVAGWVTRHPSYPGTGEEIQYFVNQAFERMWAALPAERFDRFRDVRALLAYLKMCVHAAIVDSARRSGPLTGELADELQDDSPADERSFEHAFLEQETRQELWEKVRARLANEKEVAVVEELFVLALKPRAIQARHPDLFSDTREIYRIRQNVLERLARDPELKTLAGHVERA